MVYPGSGLHVQDRLQSTIARLAAIALLINQLAIVALLITWLVTLVMTLLADVPVLITVLATIVVLMIRLPTIALLIIWLAAISLLMMWLAKALPATLTMLLMTLIVKLRRELARALKVADWPRQGRNGF